MKNLTLANIAMACGGTCFGADADREKEVMSITTDSRQAEPGSLFVAIKGERVDGHDFIDSVFEKGALCVLSERKLPEAKGPYILVESTLQAVKDIAEFYRQQLNVKVVGITGSVGKTSTKEMIASILAEKYRVLKTLGNFNNELGLPLTVFRLREEDEVAVLEMGISDFGEMHRLSKVAKPDVAVITNIGQCHLEFLHDRDGVLRAKTEIFEFLAEDGQVILNGDDDKLTTVKEVNGKAPIFFGIQNPPSIYADEIKPKGLRGIACRIHTPEGEFSVQVPIPGYHMVLNALAGTAVGLTLGLTLEEIKGGIEKLQSLSGRFHMIDHDGMLIIDDCYNASPVAVKASLDVMKDAEGRKVAVLGDMFELGAESDAFHVSVGERAAENGMDLLICVGENSRHTAKGALEKGGCKEVLHLPDLETALTEIPRLLKKGDTVLVKASHSMHFEKIVKILTEM